MLLRSHDVATVSKAQRTEEVKQYDGGISRTMTARQNDSEHMWWWYRTRLRLFRLWRTS